MKQVLWVHGVESDNFDPKQISDCADKVASLASQPIKNTIFNWNAEVCKREMVVYDIVKNFGNWITRKVRKAICYQGEDLYWTMQMLKGGQPAYIMADVMQKLDEMVMFLYKENGKAELAFVCHSWGNFICLNYLITHGEVQADIISIGNPLFYGAGAFEDWGDPDKIANIRRWINIFIESDPIACPMTLNPNPKWKKKVKDISVATWDIFAIKSHTAYWRNSKVQKLIAQELSI